MLRARSFKSMFSSQAPGAIDSEKLPGRQGRQQRGWLLGWLVYVVAIVLLGVILGYQMYSDYDRIDELERARLLHNAHMIESNISFQIDSTYQALLGIRADPSYWTQSIGQSSSRLKTISDAMPSIRTINILDGSGNVLTSGRPELVGQNFGARPYFITAMGLTDTKVLVISPPFTTSLGVWSMNIALAIDASDRGAARVITATIDPNYINILLESVIYAPSMWVSLVHWDGLRYLMVPDRPGQSGINIAQPGAFFTRYKEAGAQDMVLTGRSTSTGEDLMVGLTTLHPRQTPISKALVIMAARRLDEIFRDWWRDTEKEAGLFLLLVVISFCGLMVIHRRQLAVDALTADHTKSLIEAREAAEEAKRRAEAANRAKTTFLATMSHEVRTPITSVFGMIDLLRGTRLNEEQTGYIQTLSNSTEVLLSILNDVLDIAKIEAGKLSLDTVAFDLRQSVHGIFELCQGMASAKGLMLGLEGLDAVPARVVGDPVRLKQILHNLISNAIKFTERGSVEIRLSAEERTDENLTLAIAVTDTGIGMSPGQIDGLFQPFTQADASTTRRFGGTGLGLAITKQLVSLMGGSIEVKSEPGAGTCFRVLLPFRMAPPQEQAPSPLETKPPGPNVARMLHILLAEDNPINRKLVSTMLMKLGHTITAVANGREAVTAVTEAEFDIVLMDMQMPEMDGEEASRLIRAMGGPKAALPIIALTADVMAEHRERYLKAGVDDLVPKPIDWRVLSDALAFQTTGGKSATNRRTMAAHSGSPSMGLRTS